MGACEGSPGEMARTLPAVTARERDLREDGWSPTRRNPRGAESAAGRPGSSGNRKKLGQRAGLTYRVSFPWG